jgi:hypothetical protein
VARGLLEQTGNDGPEPWIPIGTAVHTGRSFVGAVGEGDARDFTALGDTVNTTARLTRARRRRGDPPRRVYGERGTPDSGLAPFLFGRPLGGRKSFETLVRNRFAALDRKAIGAGGKSGLGTLDSVELFA